MNWVWSKYWVCACVSLKVDYSERRSKSRDLKCGNWINVNDDEINRCLQTAFHSSWIRAASFIAHIYAFIIWDFAQHTHTHPPHALRTHHHRRHAHITDFYMFQNIEKNPYISDLLYLNCYITKLYSGCVTTTERANERSRTESHERRNKKGQNKICHTRKMFRLKNKYGKKVSK